MSVQTIEAHDEIEAAEILSQYFRSYDLLALQANERGDGVCVVEMCSKRDGSYREYCRLTGIPPTDAFMAILQPNGLV